MFISSTLYVVVVVVVVFFVLVSLSSQALISLALLFSHSVDNAIDQQHLR